MKLCGVVVLVAACQPPGATTRPAPPSQSFALADLVGGWRWMLRTTEAGTTRIEDERWRFRPVPNVPSKLAGRYVRDSRCAAMTHHLSVQQRTWTAAAVFARGRVTATGFAVREVGIAPEARAITDSARPQYVADLGGERFVLKWQAARRRCGGPTTTIARGRVADAPKSKARALGDDVVDTKAMYMTNRVWKITRRPTNALDLTYRGASSCGGRWHAITCSARRATRRRRGRPDGQREEEQWHFDERATEPGATVPARDAAPQPDEATPSSSATISARVARQRRQVL